MNKFLAIIPARGGSKRLPRKNILDLQGKPLIAWTIEAAKNSQYIDAVCVSSDDNEILSIAKKFQAQTLLRPHEIASDKAETFDAIVHTIDNMQKQYEYIILLQPTSPLRTASHIDEAIELLISKSADAIISVCETEHSPLWSNTLPANGSFVNFLSKEARVRSQELPKYYRLNGAIYICRTNRLLLEKTFFLNNNIFSYIMLQKDSVDIDNIIDFKFAELLMQTR